MLANLLYLKSFRLKRILYIFAALTLAALAGSCSGDTPRVRIGVSQCSDDDWRRKMNEEIRREAMFNDGVEVEIRSADDDSRKQIADLNYFADNGFDVIVVAPNEANSLTPAISAIHDRGIPVIVFDRSVNNDKYTAFQGADNRQIGQLVAKYAAAMSLPEVRMLEVRGLDGSTPALLRHQGLVDLADSLGIKIIGSASGKWNYDAACEVVDSMLRLHPEANVIYAHNDRMALGAADVAKSLGRHDIKIIGVDAAPTIGIAAVLEDKIDVTFLYPTHGDQLIKTALAIVDGEEYEPNKIFPIPSPVDKSIAEVLLMQDEALRNETSKIAVLQERVTGVLQQASEQRMVLYYVLVILAMSAAFIFLLLRYYWASRLHKARMEESNATLSRQRDELDRLYHQLQEATGSRLAWFTNVSHDLRTPLTLISAPVHQLAQADNLTERQHTQMQIADKNVKRLQRLINQILDLRKYDDSQLRLTLTDVNLNESLRNWIGSFADYARRRHIKLVAEIPDSPAIVTAIDVEKMERILFNLLSNAFKFTPDNGTITVTLSAVGENVVIRVADTGIGIPADEINHVMERFFHTDAINPNGSGIGLALSKVFVEMHGGTITVESKVNVGSTFTLTFPMKRTAVNQAVVAERTVDAIEVDEIENDEPATAVVAEDSPTLLVIDDNKDICVLVRSALSDQYTVISAYNGAQGIKLANKYVPDLIICDVMMPGMDGYKVCRELKADEITSHIPVLLLTACSLDEQRVEGYDSGADAYMSKPFDLSVLLARCRSLIANRKIIYDKGGYAPAASQQEASAEKVTDRADEFMRRFTELIESEIDNPDITVETLAEQMGVSRVQLYRKVKAITGFSAAEYIRVVRLRRAAVILKTTDSTVSEAAYAVGFSSPNYFTRCYKDYFGESPSDTHSRIYKSK